MEQPLSVSEQLDDLSGRVVVITGGSGGIGRATARLFASEDIRVICLDLKRPAEAAADAAFYQVDVADHAAVGRCIEQIVAEHGKIDFLVNNAGIARDAMVWKMAEEQWDAVIDVNLKGAFNLIHHVAPHFRARSGGRIINVTSINGMRGKPGLANYSAAKAGLIGLTKTVARELGRYNVTVNAVAPGLVLTEMTRELPAKILDAAVAETVLGRLATPRDVAGVILFLCTSAARHVTGEVIRVDGGQYI